MQVGADKDTDDGHHQRAVAGAEASNGVSNTPGATVITRMPRLAKSLAMGKVMATMPPLEAA